MTDTTAQESDTTAHELDTTTSPTVNYSETTLSEEGNAISSTDSSQTEQQMQESYTNNTTSLPTNFQQELTEDFEVLQQQCKELLEKIMREFKRHKFSDFTWAGRIKIALRLSNDIVFKNDSPLTFVKLKPKPDYFMGGIQVFWITWYECLTSWGKPYIIKNTKVAYFDKNGVLKYKAEL